MPSKNVTRLAKWSSIPLALVASSAMVWQASYSAFSATTDNPASNWTAGSVALSDDDGSSALFTATAAPGLKPGQTGTKCIVVSVPAGKLASTVKLYGVSPATTNALSSHLDLVVEEGNGGSFNNCTGFVPTGTAFTGTLAAFGTAHTSFANGWGTWAPAASTAATRTYRFTYTLNDNAPNSTQSGTASIAFRWEAQNS